MLFALLEIAGAPTLPQPVASLGNAHAGQGRVLSVTTLRGGGLRFLSEMQSDKGLEHGTLASFLAAKAWVCCQRAAHACDADNACTTIMDLAIMIRQLSISYIPSVNKRSAHNGDGPLAPPHHPRLPFSIADAQSLTVLMRWLLSYIYGFRATIPRGGPLLRFGREHGSCQMPPMRMFKNHRGGQRQPTPGNTQRHHSHPHAR